ncbi:LysM peptidoglycan-binding domain-containing protein, partial [candidate division NPL-UPA2 bacterium]|nr:LysM peptidoglycan-binding domain-containing protein [candidate division NPL-UPA2 bacterium]
IEELAITHTVVKGETLWDIAGYEHIYGDPLMWRVIFEANRDILDHPDALRPGQVLVIPRK